MSVGLHPIEKTVAWYNPSDWFLSAEDIAKGAEADRRLEELNRQAWEQGKITTEEYNRRRGEIDANSSDKYQAQVDDAFREGWREGEQTVAGGFKAVVGGVTGAAGSVIGAPLRGILAGIPWWLWIVGVLAALVYLGALPRILAELRKL